MEIEKNTIGYTPTGEASEPLTPVDIHSLRVDAEQLVTVYGALITYLKGLFGF